MVGHLAEAGVVIQDEFREANMAPVIYAPEGILPLGADW